MVHEKLPVPLPFEELIQRHEREIMRYLLRVSGDREDAADLFQETWLRAYRAYPRLHPESDVRPWLYAIATNLGRNHYARAETRRTENGDEDAEYGTDDDAPDAALLAQAEARSVIAAS